MTKESFLAHHNVKDNAIVLEDWNVFSKGIVGVTDDGRIVYNYDLTAIALAENFAGVPLETLDQDTRNDFMDQAYEWLDYNTFGMIDTLSEDVKPVFVSDDSEPDIDDPGYEPVQQLEFEVA